MAVTPFQYYEGDDSQHGNYQYVSAKDILDAMEFEALDEDSYLKTVPRSKLLYHLRQGIKEVTRRAANEILAIEFTVPDNLVWTLPQDYLDYKRISVVVMENGTRRLQPLDINSSINTGTGYLQDNNWKILFDNNGKILTADSANAYAFPYKTYEFCEAGGQGNLDTSKLSQYGEFKIDKRRGKILFSSQLSDCEVVLEYDSDGLQADLTDSEITIHKDIEQCVKDWIYTEAISMKRNVPANEKMRARQRYKTSLHQSKLDQIDLNLLQINRTMRTKTMTP